MGECTKNSSRITDGHQGWQWRVGRPDEPVWRGSFTTDAGHTITGVYNWRLAEYVAQEKARRSA